MKYAVIQCINGNFSVHAEGFTDINAAKISFHQFCAALWNDPGTKKATVKIVDEQLDCAEGYQEFILHLVEENNESA